MYGDGLQAREEPTTTMSLDAWANATVITAVPTSSLQDLTAQVRAYNIQNRTIINCQGHTFSDQSPPTSKLYTMSGDHVVLCNATLQLPDGSGIIAGGTEGMVMKNITIKRSSHERQPDNDPTEVKPLLQVIQGSTLQLKNCVLNSQNPADVPGLETEYGNHVVKVIGERTMFNAETSVLYGAMGAGVWVGERAEAVLSGCTIEHNKFAGVDVDNAYKVEMTYCNIKMNRGSGVRVSGDGTRFILRGSTISGNKLHGMELNNASKAWIIDSNVFDNEHQGLRASGVGTSIDVSGCSMFNNWKIAVNAEDGARIVIDDAEIFGNNWAAVAAMGVGSKVVLIDSNVSAKGEWIVYSDRSSEVEVIGSNVKSLETRAG